MKKQLITIALCSALALPAIASTTKPFSISNHSDKAMLTGALSDAKVDLTGTVFGMTPLAKGQSWSSTITVNRPSELAVAVVEDDGFGLTDIFDQTADIKAVCWVSTNLSDDSNAVFHNAIVTNISRNHSCAISSDEKSLEIN